VICDSVDESTETAFRHALQRWPELRRDLGNSVKPFLQPMRVVRPVVETGWENTMLVRGLADGGVVPKEVAYTDLKIPAYANLKYAVSGDNTPPMWEKLCKDVLRSWDKVRNKWVDNWGIDYKEMIEEFGTVRDEWIEKDVSSWLRRNRAYDMVPDCIEAMMAAGAEVFIITTKQRRFCTMLLREFDLEIPDDRIFALEDGPKLDVLRELLRRPDLAGRDFHFVEDKLGTLRKVAAEPDLSAVNLHLVTWGYVTVAQVKIVKAGLEEGISPMTPKGLENVGGVPWMELE